MSWKTLTSLRGQLLMAVLMVWSALSVVNSTHQSRVLYSELQALEASRWRMQEDYSRLVLELSTLSAPHRVSSESNKLLAMNAPDTGDIKVVVE
jgi:cell division protein FtsL